MDLSREQRGQNVDKNAVAGNHEQTLDSVKPFTAGALGANLSRNKRVD